MTPIAAIPGPRERAPAGTTWRSKLAISLLFLPFLTQMLLQFERLFRLVILHNDSTYPEGACVYAFLTVSHSGRLYSSPLDFPWNAEWYGPLFYLAGGVVAKFCHGDPTWTTITFRLMSLASFAGSVALVAFLSWKLEGSKLWPVLVAAMGLGCIWAGDISATARPDMLSIVFILAALAVYLLGEDRLRPAFLAGVLASLSLLIKQSTAPILVALAVDCLIAGKPRKTVAMLAGAIPVPAALFLTLWFRHEPFIANLTAMGHTVMMWSTVPSTLIDNFRTNQIASIPLLLALLGAAVSWRSERYRTVLIVTAAAWTVNVAALANVGGAANYLVLPYLLSLLFVPAGVLWIGRQARVSELALAALGLLGIAFLVHQKNLVISPVPAPVDASPVQNLNMLSDLPYLEMHSHKPQLLDPYYYHQLVLENQWKSTAVSNNIDRGAYDLVLVSGSDSPGEAAFTLGEFRGVSFWGPETIDELLTKYRVACEVGDATNGQHLAMVPRGRLDTVEAAEIASIFHTPCYGTDRRPHLAPGTR